MNEVAFVAAREPDWQRLTYLCDKADATPARLATPELHELVRLYRKVSTDLATVRTKSSNLQLIQFLNDLVGRAYGIIYRPIRGPFWKAVGIGLETAAQSARRLRWFVLTSTLIFVLGAFFSFLALQFAPETRHHFVGKGQEELMDAWKSGHFEERTLDENIAMTGMYSANNPRAAIATGGLAAGTFGVGTAYVLWTNGMLIGTLAYELSTVNKVGQLVYIAPHGVTEISGFILAGAAGLHLGWALINPGRRRRGQAMKLAGKDAIVALTASVVMMFLAAPVEGFISFNPAVPLPFKILFAITVAIAWIFFWVGFGRKPGEFSAEAVPVTH